MFLHFGFGTPYPAHFRAFSHMKTWTRGRSKVNVFVTLYTLDTGLDWFYTAV